MLPSISATWNICSHHLAQVVWCSDPACNRLLAACLTTEVTFQILRTKNNSKRLQLTVLGYLRYSKDSKILFCRPRHSRGLILRVRPSPSPPPLSFL